MPTPNMVPWIFFWIVVLIGISLGILVLLRIGEQIKLAFIAVFGRVPQEPVQVVAPQPQQQGSQPQQQYTAPTYNGTGVYPQDDRYYQQ